VASVVLQAGNFSGNRFFDFVGDFDGDKSAQQTHTVGLGWLSCSEDFIDSLFQFQKTDWFGEID